MAKFPGSNCLATEHKHSHGNHRGLTADTKGLETHALGMRLGVSLLCSAWNKVRQGGWDPRRPVGPSAWRMSPVGPAPLLSCSESRAKSS